MALSLAAFCELLTDNGNDMIMSAARLAHVADGAAILLPASQQLSRYTIQPQASALVAVKTTLEGITTAYTGLPAQLDAAQTALQAADLTSIEAVRQASGTAARPSAYLRVLRASVFQFLRRRFQQMQRVETQPQLHTDAHR
jgi:hypothetical protein